jgi:hypothetical protein
MKTEYNHGGAISNVWQNRNEFRWANRAGEGAESTFELAVQAAETALNPTATIMQAINALPRGAALCEHFAYIFRPDDDPEQPAQLLVDILAWRTNSQRAEDEQFLDQSDLLHAIESLPSVANVEQVGDVDHENGRGWTYQVTLA